MKNPQTKTPKSQTKIPFSQSPSMESFSLLTFLRRDDNGDGVVSTGTTGFVSKEENQKINEVKSEENCDLSDDEDDEGPFFDLEFTGAQEDVDNRAQEHDEESDFGEEEEDDDELNFIDPNLSLSPSDELFFKGSFIQLDSSSPGLSNSSPNSKSHQFPAVSFLKSATKFRVFMLGFKKPKSEKKSETQTQNQTKEQQKKFLTVKLKVEEVPIISLFTKERKDEEIAAAAASSDEKKLAKYLKMIKQGSKRYGEKMKFSGNLGKTSSSTSPTSVIPSFSSSPSKKISSSPTTGFRVVCKHLGKSRSASSSSSSSTSMATTVLQSKRQDDSLLQQEDGIQSAILHCKRSFNSSSSCRDSSSLLSRSTSDPTHEKKSSIDLLRKSQSITDERKGNRF